MARIGVHLIACVLIGASSVQALHVHDAETQWPGAQCQYFPQARMVLLVQANSEFVEAGILDNWFNYASQYIPNDVQLVIDTPDMRAQELISNDPQYSHAVIVDENLCIHTSGTSCKAQTMVPHGTEDFIRMRARRINLVDTLLAASCSVLSVDIDTVWKGNPFEDLDPVANQNMLVTTDDSCTPDRTVCGCFLYFNQGMVPGAGWGHFMSDWRAATTEGIGTVDQISLDWLIRTKRRTPDQVDVHMLHRSTYPAGCYTQPNMNSTIIHANHIVGVDEKIEYLNRLNMWSQPIPPRTVPNYDTFGPPCGGGGFLIHQFTKTPPTPCTNGCDCVWRNAYYSQCMCVQKTKRVCGGPGFKGDATCDQGCECMKISAEMSQCMCDHKEGAFGIPEGIIR